MRDRHAALAWGALVAGMLALGGCVSITRTEASYSERLRRVEGVPNLRVGVRDQTVNGVASQRYVILHGSTTDTLGRGEEPGGYLKACERQGRELHVCAGLALLWGAALRALGDGIEPAEEVRERGWRFSIAGYRQLAADLRRNDRSAGGALRRHGAFLPAALSARDYFAKEPPDYRLARAEYGLALWPQLPQSTDDFDTFDAVRIAAESLKDWLDQLLGDDKAPPLPVALMDPILAFWDGASEFHRRPVPASTQAPRLISASLLDGMSASGIGYARWPGDERVRPLRVLATTDLEYARRTLARFEAWKLIDAASVRTRIDELDRRIYVLREEELRASLARAERAADLERAHELRRDLAFFSRDRGRLREAEEWLVSTLSYLQSSGQRQLWATSTMDLASYRAKAGDWVAVRRLIGEVRCALMDGAGIHEWRRLRDYERQVALQGGAPVTEDKAGEAAHQSLVDVLRDLETIDAELDPKQRIAKYAAMWQRAGASDPERLLIGFPFLGQLVREREFGDAEDLGNRLRPIVTRLRGSGGEANLRGVLLPIQRQRGNLGAYEANLAEYERLRRPLAGRNWRGDLARLLAEVAFAFEDYQSAEEHLRWKLEHDYVRHLESGLFFSSHLDVDLNDPQDKILLARVYLARGERDAAAQILRRLEDEFPVPTKDASVRNSTHLTTALEMACDLAEAEISGGEYGRAESRLEPVLARVKPVENLPLWTRAALLQARAQLQGGRQADALAQQFADMAPQLLDFRDLNAQAGIDMDLFLVEYHRAARRVGDAEFHVRRALRAAADLGNLDQQIVAHRLAGELRADAADTPGAIEAYRRSIALLQRVSREIPGDIEKVGYRADRAKAVTLLVDALYLDYTRSGDPRQLGSLIEAAEQGKAQALSEVLLSRTARGGTFSLDQIMRALPPETGVMAFYFGAGDDARLYRAVIDRKGARFDALPLTARQAEQRARALLDRLANPHRYEERKFRAEAAMLARELFPASWAGFDEIPYRRLFIVPAGPLYLLPFGALVDGRDRYLDEARIEVAYLSNLSMVALPAPVLARGVRAAAIVNPSLELEHHELLAASPDLRRRFEESFRKWSGGNVLWERPWSSDDFAKSAPALDNVFLYSHARFLPSDPLNSYVRLDTTRTGQTRITAREISRGRVGGGLWVLAACSTGAGRVRPGDEVLGLPRALLQAGARGVVISLWDVDAASSLELMAHFYERLAEGKSIAAAMKSATAALRRHGRPPFDWAPFLLVGQHDFHRS